MKFVKQCLQKILSNIHPFTR